MTPPPAHPHLWLRAPTGRFLAALLGIGLFITALFQAGLAAPLVVSPLYTFPDNSFPAGIVYGMNDAYWLTLLGSNHLAKVPGAALPESFNIPSISSRAFDLTIGPDQNLWFTEQDGNKIGKMTPQGIFSEFALPNPGSSPSQIVLGQDGNLWFTEYDGNRIGRISPQGVIVEFPLPNAGSKPLGLTSDLAGNLWFTEWTGQRIGKISPQGDISEYPISGIPFHPAEIVLGSDGGLWVTYEIGRQVTRVDPANGNMSHFSLTTTSDSLADLALGADGKMWFLGIQTTGSFDTAPSGVSGLTEVALPTPIFTGTGRSQITQGPTDSMAFITANTSVINTVSPVSTLRRELQVFNELPPVLLAAGPFEWKLWIANWSALPASNLTLTLDLDQGFTFLSADAFGGTCAPSGTQVICQLASLPGKTVLPVNLHLQIGRISESVLMRSLTAQVQSAEGDYFPANNRLFRSVRVQRTIDYFNDFNKGADPFWTHVMTTTPRAGLTYLGPFDHENVALTLSSLPPHDLVRVCFDLYILGPWDGASAVEPGSYPPLVIGPDIWSHYVNEDKYLTTSFSNRLTIEQNYPADYPASLAPAMYRAQEVGEFNADASSNDTRYRLCYDRFHQDSSYKGTFYATNLDDAGSETWGLDNVSVTIQYKAVNDWLYLSHLER